MMTFCCRSQKSVFRMTIMKISIWLLTIIGFMILVNAVHVPGPGPGPGLGPGPIVTSSVYNTGGGNSNSQYTAFPRRRSSSGSDGSQMQSRAVDTRVQLEIMEGDHRGTVVGYIPTKPGFTYRFNEPPREFILDQITGEIKTNMILDREDMRDRYDLVVLSSQPTYPIEVRITVLDINDNAPEFPEPSIAISFSESAAPGTRLLLDAATDRDIGMNSVTDDYRIVDGNHDDKFRLAVTTNPSGDVSYLHLETTGKLDRENRGYYSLNVSARDGGSPPKHGYLQVNVTIVDVNDNPPIFDHSDYIVSLNESVPPGTPVLQVMASDNDLGDNSKITYYLSDTETQFTVDPETGVISTTEHLACPQQNCPTYPRPGNSCPKSCVFTVFARDHGSPRQDGRTYVTVNLVDTNDHDPMIRFQYFPSTGSFATVDENAVNGSVVAAVSVEDMDEGLNGETTIRIISGNEMQHFRLEKTPSFDIVRVNGILDREEIGKYNLTVVATDKGTPQRTAIAYLIIHVNDVNDHEPVFEKSEYSAILSELAPAGTYVASITATDEDTGVNAQIFYDFVFGNTKQWFTIDQASGLITTQAILDREIQGTIVMNISARDGGPNPKWAYTQLKVIILDENDEAPQFSQSHINVTLSENIPPQTLVAMLTASDHDQGTNGSVTYTLPSIVQQNYPDMFALDSLTGQLMTKTQLDRETISQYEIFVIARDQGIPPQSATATVLLNVDDINDNSPEFYPKQYFLSVADDSKIGTSLLKVTATDRDFGENALITYNLENGGDGLFTIDQWSGIVTLRGNFRTATKSFYKLTVSSKDHGDRRSDKDATIEIVKQSKMEIIEFETKNGYEFQIAEDHAKNMPVLGREVGKVQARSIQKQQVEYSIVYGDPDENFEIDQRTGVITTSKNIDRESMIQYRLSVVARAGLAYGKINVNISILDLNDNTPIFAHDRDDILLSENAAVGQEVYLSRARDKDSGINSRVSYSLTYNPDDQFRISEATGVLYLNRPIRSEPATILHVELTATDGGIPPLSSKNTITITIADVNDHTPVFDHTSYETSLLESTQVNARFFALSASDTDLGANGRIAYEIIEGNVEAKFGIFPDGYLFVKSQLDREERDYYSLTISCRDHGIPSRSSVVPVIIHVIDENDNPPQFTNSTFTFTIPENEPIDSFVGKLTAIDRDIGRNAELIYSLMSREMDFSIDIRNGFIKTLRPFDREALVQRTGQNFIQLEAIVSDNGVQRLRDKVKVKIIITDVNDNAPQFLRAPYKVQISEGASIGTQLIRVFTIDADEELNGDVFYLITDGNQDGRFSIDDATGQISLAKSLDRETKSIYKLTVLAHDAALKGQLSATTTVTVEILDENDDAPEFTQTDTQISVIETSPIGTELMKFRATDSDLGINNQIQFSIAAGNRRDTFHIDPFTGSLYLHKSLDYEDTQLYSLNITAADGGNPRLSTTIMFIVNVVDENDNSPSFPNTAIVRQIREGIPIKTPIVTINAEDPDSGLNGKVTYAIIKQDPDDQKRHFGINSATGVIHTLKKIDRESIDTFRLMVLATDQAENPLKRLSAEKLVTVIVEDVNDNAPVFVSMNAAILPIHNNNNNKNQLSLQHHHHRQDNVNGNLPGRDGSIIMYVKARDLDSSTNGLVTYEMVSGNMDLFQLHRSTGAITLRKQILKPDVRYQLAIKATDEAVQTERKSSDAYITIIASNNSLLISNLNQLNGNSLGGNHHHQNNNNNSDLMMVSMNNNNNNNNNNGPVFDQREQIGSVYENEPAGTSILTVSARLNSADIEYYITNVTSIDGRQVDRLFDIDTKLGILSTASELDRESGIDTYEIEVYAIALGGIPRTTNTKDDHDKLNEFFSIYGPVSHVQIRKKFKCSDGDRKVSGFIKFMDCESVLRVLEDAEQIEQEHNIIIQAQAIENSDIIVPAPTPPSAPSALIESNENVPETTPSAANAAEPATTPDTEDAKSNNGCSAVEAINGEEPTAELIGVIDHEETEHPADEDEEDDGEEEEDEEEEPEERGPINITDLNNDCLCHIFLFLTRLDQIRFSIACSRRFTEALKLFANRNRTLKIDTRLSANDVDEIIEEIHDNDIQIEKLEIFDSKHHLERFLNGFQNLQHLKIQSNEMHLNDFRCIERHLTNLNTLELLNCNVCDENLLESFTRVGRLVKYLDLSDNIDLLGLGLHKFNRLETLKLRNCPNIRLNNFGYICGVTTSLCRIELEMMAFKNFDHNFAEIFLQLRNIIEISIFHCSFFSDFYSDEYKAVMTFLKRIAQSDLSHQLQVLKVPVLWKAGDINIVFMFRNLKHLAIRNRDYAYTSDFYVKVKLLTVLEGLYYACNIVHFKDEILSIIENLQQFEDLIVLDCEDYEYFRIFVMDVIAILRAGPVSRPLLRIWKKRISRVELNNLYNDIEFINNKSRIKMKFGVVV